LRQLTEKNEHRCHPTPIDVRSHPQESFHGGSFGVSGTPPTKPFLFAFGQ
jgi:hypothetical protein